MEEIDDLLEERGLESILEDFNLDVALALILLDSHGYIDLEFYDERDK